MSRTLTIDIDGTREFTHCLSLVKHEIRATYDPSQQVWTADKFVASDYANLIHIVERGGRVWDDMGRDQTIDELREAERAQQAIDTVRLNHHQGRESTPAQIAAAEAAEAMFAGRDA